MISLCFPVALCRTALLYRLKVLSRVRNLQSTSKCCQKTNKLMKAVTRVHVPTDGMQGCVSTHRRNSMIAKVEVLEFHFSSKWVCAIANASAYSVKALFPSCSVPFFYFFFQFCFSDFFPLIPYIIG